MQLILSTVAAAAAMLAPGAPALPSADLATVSEAAGQLFWASPSVHGTVTLRTRPTAGGAVRALGTVRTPGGSPSVAFDGTTYVVAFSAVTGVDTSGENCGVCETDLSQEQQVITGTLEGAPTVVATCSADDVAAPAAQVALAAGRPFFADACHPGIRGVDGTFDAEGRLPLRGAGSWLSYAHADGVRVLDLIGGGAYTVPAPAGSGGLWLQADGSIILGTALYRTGGTAPPVVLHPAWAEPALFAGDRVFSGDLSMTSAQGTSRIVVPGLGAKRALSLANSTLTVAGASCTGAVRVRAVALTRSAAVDGCPVEVITGTLRLARNRTITVAVRCRNGCRGTLNLASGDVLATAALKAAPGARAAVRFRLTRTEARHLRQSARFGSYHAYLTVKRGVHHIRTS